MKVLVTVLRPTIFVMKPSKRRQNKTDWAGLKLGGIPPQLVCACHALALIISHMCLKRWYPSRSRPRPSADAAPSRAAAGPPPGVSDAREQWIQMSIIKYTGSKKTGHREEARQVFSGSYNQQHDVLRENLQNHCNHECAHLLFGRLGFGGTDSLGARFCPTNG